MKVEIIDEMCGTGKTHAMIQWMKKNPQVRYLYISPLLSEIEERIYTECDELNFMYPVATPNKSKGEHLLELLQEGHNIAFTHNLYGRLDKRHIEAIKAMQYTLLVDEEVSMIEPLVSLSDEGYDCGYTNNDLKYLYNDGKLSVDKEDFGRLVWEWEDYSFDAKYTRLRSMCDLGMLYCADSKQDSKTGDTVDEIHSLVLQLPLKLLEACKRVILISYMFRGSVMDSFLKLKGVDVVDFDKDAEGVSLRYSTAEVINQIKSLITFVETKSTKKIGRKRLSYTWYQKEFDRTSAKEIAAAIRSVGLQCGAKWDEVMWTLPKIRAFKSRRDAPTVEPKGYSANNCFVFCAARATNKYSHKSTLVHAVQRHPNVTVQKYLQHHNIEINCDSFALSELIQWIWRSQIRDMKPINICILSNYMDKLFKDWLNSKWK